MKQRADEQKAHRQGKQQTKPLTSSMSSRQTLCSSSSLAMDAAPTSCSCPSSPLFPAEAPPPALRSRIGMSDTNYPTEAEGLGGIRRNSTDGSVAPALLRRRRGACSAQRPERAGEGEAEDEPRPPPAAAAAAARFTCAS